MQCINQARQAKEGTDGGRPKWNDNEKKIKQFS